MTISWWTLGIQAINVVILAWLLGRFFWRPLAAMIEQRRAATVKILADATMERDRAKQALAEIESTRAGLGKERDAILDAARNDAGKMQAESVSEGARQVGVLQQAGKATIAVEREAAAKAWAEQASHLAVDIAGRLASRLEGAAVRGSFLDWLAASIHALPDAERQAACLAGVTLDVISATELEPDDRDDCQTRIASAFGGHPQLAFKTDPALIEGFELHGSALAITNSWRADLAQILTDLTHDDQR